MYAILVQKTDDMDYANFHIEELELTPARNLQCFLIYGHSNPFSLIGLKEDWNEANKFVEEIRKEYNLMNHKHKI